MRAGALPELDERRFQRLLLLALAAGLLLRLGLTAATAGNVFDLGSEQLVAHLLVTHPLHLYAYANAGATDQRWPYLPGFFPVLLALKGVAVATGLPFEKVVRVAPALSDLAIAWLVQDYLAHRGAGYWQRLTGAALVVFGPTFVAVSGVHGQIDSVAILPTVAALSIWERDAKNRGLKAGLLIGLGAAIKTVPGLMLLALLPSARNRREAVELTAATVVVPLAAAAPYLLAVGTAWLHRVFGYHGGIGLGGFSLVAQPTLALDWLHVAYHPLSAVSRWFLLHGGLPAGASVLLAAGTLLYLRTPAPLAACVLWLTIYTFGITFFQQYMVWGLPFFLMTAPLAWTAALEALLLMPVFLTYHGVRHVWTATAFYVVPMISVWVVLAGALVVAFRAAARVHGPRPAPAR